MNVSQEQKKLYDDLATWVKAYQQGDKTVFDHIYKATFKHVAAYVKLHEIPENDREDLIQEAYITAGNNIMTLKDPQACYKWLMRITANTVVDYFRKNKKRLDMEVFEKEKPDDSIGTDEQLYKQKSTQERADDEMISVPENIMDNKETQKILFTLVNDSLKPMQSEILYLRCYGEKSFREIAEKLNVPEATVKTQFRRSLDKVQKAILKTEKEQGIRLHSVGVIPFVAGLFFVYASAQDASAAEMGAIYAGIQSELASGATAAEATVATEATAATEGTVATEATAASEVAAAAGGAASSGAVAKGALLAGTVAKFAGLSIGKKIVAGIVCAALIGGGVGAAYHVRTSQAKEVSQTENTIEEQTEEELLQENSEKERAEEVENPVQKNSEEEKNEEVENSAQDNPEEMGQDGLSDTISEDDVAEQSTIEDGVYVLLFVNPDVQPPLNLHKENYDGAIKSASIQAGVLTAMLSLDLGATFAEYKIPVSEEVQIILYNTYEDTETNINFSEFNVFTPLYNFFIKKYRTGLSDV